MAYFSEYFQKSCRVTRYFKIVYGHKMLSNDKITNDTARTSFQMLQKQNFFSECLGLKTDSIEWEELNLAQKCRKRRLFGKVTLIFIKMFHLYFWIFPCTLFFKTEIIVVWVLKKCQKEGIFRKEKLF